MFASGRSNLVKLGEMLGESCCFDQTLVVGERTHKGCQELALMNTLDGSTGSTSEASRCHRLRDAGPISLVRL